MNWALCIADLPVYLYSAVLDGVRIIGAPLLRRLGEKRQWDFDKRQKLPSPLRDFRGKPVVWIHAASLGEAKLLLTFVDMLQQRHHDELYVVTATTRNGVTFLEQHRHPAFCATGFLPFDTRSLVGRVISHYGVKRVWLLETELWPSLLQVCRQRGIAVGVVNGRIERASFRWYNLLRWFITPLISPLAPVFVQTNVYAERFEQLGVNRSSLFTVGNIKGHIRIARPDRRDWAAVRQALHISEDEFVVTAGCIHRGEGAVLKAFVRRMNELSYPCKLIVVPRHLEEAAAIMEELGDGVVHLTDVETARPWSICCIEKIGILDAMYSTADAAVVGGTFVTIGGHNVWDAACYAIPVFFGPFFEKQKESCTVLADVGVGFEVPDGDTLGEKMYNVVKGDPVHFIRAQQKFVALTDEVRSQLEPLLP